MQSNAPNENQQAEFAPRPFTFVFLALVPSTTSPHVQVKENERRIQEQIDLEEKRFLKTIAAGEAELQKAIGKAKEAGSDKVLPGSVAFQLYDAHGFPLELTVEVAAAEGLTVDEAGFQHEMSQQKARSKVRYPLL